ncbi:MAG: hypothetical protein KDD37_11250, partial [Bdellovibrionales bacterium]|nr:hypothetical protein [Bdellovibrionales bacterium]
ELRDAPIASIEDGMVIVETVANLNDRPHQFTLELKPRDMSDTAVIYVTQDLNGVLVSVSPIFQSLSA